MSLSARSVFIQSAVCMALMAATVYVESFTALDMEIQRQWYSSVQGRWFIDASLHREWRWLFYDGMKYAVAATGAGSVVLFLAGCYLNNASWRRAGLLMALSCAATPLLVALLKAVTGIYCPRQLLLFGGEEPYRHLLPLEFGILGGRCFPGGHASGGFALTMMYFCLSGKYARLSALAAALCMGWSMGLYQMMRGEHFLSHTVMSMLLAWQMNLLLVRIADGTILPWISRRKHGKMP